MLRQSSRRAAQRRGTATVELAVLLPFLAFFFRGPKFPDSGPRDPHVGDEAGKGDLGAGAASPELTGGYGIGWLGLSGAKPRLYTRCRGFEDSAPATLTRGQIMRIRCNARKR